MKDQEITDQILAKQLSYFGLKTGVAQQLWYLLFNLVVCWQNILWARSPIGKL